jgi:hypothetical protein
MHSAMTLEEFRSIFPAEGFFAEKEWLLSPEPFPLEPGIVEEIRALGHRLRVFLRASNAIYLRSVKGSLPPWIAAYLDAGKPSSLLDLARARPLRGELPRIIRPDLLLTEEGLALSEIDSVPGGIGLTAWLNQTYANHAGLQILGGARGMLAGFESIFPAGMAGADIVVSAEAAVYRPEMEWLAAQFPRGQFAVHAAETYSPDPVRAVYRFFELFDLPNIPAAGPLIEAVAAGRVRMTAPAKPWLEEKLWLALFWLRPLEELWRRELSENQQRRLAKIIPYSWIVDSSPLPHHAVLPRLDISDWKELGRFSQKARELVLKLSGFNERAWGARSVTVGHDVPQATWAAALDAAVASFPDHPFVLQTFQRAKVVEHPFFDRETGAVRTMRARARLCPYYFVSAADESITLGGVLATLVPEDKKILHGMPDAILVPCSVLV